MSKIEPFIKDTKKYGYKFPLPGTRDKFGYYYPTVDTIFLDQKKMGIEDYSLPEDRSWKSAVEREVVGHEIAHKMLQKVTIYWIDLYFQNIVTTLRFGNVLEQYEKENLNQSDLSELAVRVRVDDELLRKSISFWNSLQEIWVDIIRRISMEDVSLAFKTKINKLTEKLDRGKNKTTSAERDSVESLLPKKRELIRERVFCSTWRSCLSASRKIVEKLGKERGAEYIFALSTLAANTRKVNSSSGKPSTEIEMKIPEFRFVEMLAFAAKNADFIQESLERGVEIDKSSSMIPQFLGFPTINLKKIGELVDDWERVVKDEAVSLSDSLMRLWEKVIESIGPTQWIIWTSDEKLHRSFSANLGEEESTIAREIFLYTLLKWKFASSIEGHENRISPFINFARNYRISLTEEWKIANQFIEDIKENLNRIERRAQEKFEQNVMKSESGSLY